MASVDVKEIISKQGIDSVNKTTEALEKSYLALQDNIVGYKALNDVIARSKGMSDMSKNIDNSAIAQEKLKQAIIRTEQAEIKLAQTKATEFAKEEARQAKLLANEQAQLAKDEAKIARIKRIEEAETIRAAKKAQIDADELSKSSQITGAQANEATARGRVTVETEGVTKAKKLSNIEQEKANQLAKIDRLNLVAQAKEGIAVKGSLEQRSLALARLQKTYSLLTVEERASPFGQRLAKTIPQLNTQVLTLESSLGKSQRNVGNYGNAFTKAFSGIRTLANILPGIGISGLFLVAFEGLEKLTAGLELFKSKTTQAKAAQENLNSALSEGSYADAVKNVNELRINIDLAKQGFVSKEEVLKQYNETIGKTTGEVKTLNEAETALNKNADAYIQFTLLKAAAQLSLKNAAEETVKAAQQAQEDEERLVKQQTSFRIVGDKEGEAVRKVLTKTLKRENEQRVKDGEEAQKKQLTIAEKFQKQAADLAKKYGFSGLIPTTKDKVKDNSKEREKDASDSAAALVQIQIDSVKEQADIYKEQADNQNFSEESRLTAQERFQERSIKLTQLEAEKSKVGKKNTADELKAIESKQQSEESKILQDGVKKRNEIIIFSLAEQERFRLIQAQRVLTLIEKQRDEELTALIASYQKTGDYSEKAQEELEINRLKIINKYGQLVIDEQIKQAQKLIEIRRSQGYDVTKDEADLSALILKGKELEVKQANDLSDKRLEKEKQNAEKLKEVAQAVFDFSRELTNGIFEANISNLEAEKEARQKNTDLQIENVNESMLSEKEKADQTAVLTAQGEQQQAALDAKIREQKRKQAVADKAFALAQIAINTAVAISKALALPFIGAFVIPGIIALGAIQAATVLAQPIPKFAKGGMMQKDGLAEYGHGTELRIDPDGRTSLTKDTPEIGFVKKGTRFISAPETKRLMGKPDKYDVAGKSWDISGLIAESQLTRKEFKKAINSISVKSTIITEKGFSSQSAKMNKINNYVNRNFKR